MSMEATLHVSHEENFNVELSPEKYGIELGHDENKVHVYRILKIRADHYQKQITIFLTIDQARQIAETILAGLEDTEVQAEQVPNSKKRGGEPNAKG